MRNQKTISRLPRLLALAVVSYVFMVLLTGCTKEEFVAGYNEFMFGDWLPAYGSTSQSAGFLCKIGYRKVSGKVAFQLP